MARRMVSYSLLLLLVGIGTAVSPFPPQASANVNLICGLEDTDIGLGLAGIDIIVVSPGGNPDPRIPSSIVQLACTPEEYRMLFPELPAESERERPPGNQLQLLHHLATNPSERDDFDSVFSSGEYIPFIPVDTKGMVEFKNVCYAEDCSQAEDPCYEPPCEESDCQSNCDLVIPCDPQAAVGCIPGPPCTGLDCLPCNPLEDPCVPCQDLSCVPDVCNEGETVEECLIRECNELGVIDCDDPPCNNPDECIPPIPCQDLSCLPDVCEEGETLRDCVNRHCQSLGFKQCENPPCQNIDECVPPIPCSDLSCLPCDPDEEAAVCLDQICAEVGGCNLPCPEEGCVPCDGGCDFENLCDLTGSPTVCSVEECLQTGFCLSSQPNILSSPASGGPDCGGFCHLTIVFPDQSDPQSPSGRCMEDTTIAAVEEILAEFPSAGFQYWCYDSLNPAAAWTPSSNGEVVDYNVLLDSCVNYMDTHIDWTVDDPDEMALCWVAEATANGAASGKYSLVAEHPSDWWRPDHPNVALTEHELLHSLGAHHFPDDSWRKYVGGVWHLHWWGWHPHIYKSVMNYAWLKVGETHIDGHNHDHVDPNIN